MFRGRALAAALMSGALAGGVAVSGCGSDDGGGGGTANLTVLQRAASATAKQQSFHLTSDTVQTVVGKRVALHAEGDSTATKTEIHFDFGPLVESLGGSAALGGALDKVGGAAALKADMITDGGTLLLRMPALQRGLKVFAHKDEPAWAGVDLAKVGRLAGVDLGTLIAGSTGSEQAVGYLRALTGSLKTVGTETIDGTKTTHYRGTIDFAHLPTGSVKPAQRRAMAQVAKLLQSTGATTKVPLDVWVDGENLLRREVISQTVAGNKSVTTLNLSDFGKAVDIAVPAASERYDALALVEELAPGALAQLGKQLKTGGVTP